MSKFKSKFQSPNDQSNPKVKACTFDFLDFDIDLSFGFCHLKFKNYGKQKK